MSDRFRCAGFTLVELLTTLCVAAVLAALGGLALFHGTGRVRVSNAAFETSTLYVAAQTRAASLGVPHYIVFYEAGAGSGAYLVERPDALGALDWSSVDVTDAAVVGGTRREHLRFSSEGGVAFLDLGSPRLQPRPLPAPFSSIPLTPSGTRGLLGGCSFCTESNGVVRGVLRFSPDGTVQVVTGTAETGGALAFVPASWSGQGGPPKLVVIAAPAGATRVF